MSQSDFGTINPNTKSGTQLATDLNDFRDALNSLHSGSSRPAYAGAGLLWLDTTGTPWILKLFDGTDDITLGTFNATTNVFAAAGVLASSTDNAVPRFNGTTGAIQNSGVIVDDNDGIRVPGNLKLSKGTDIASGTAITIPTDGNFFDITGTTTIATIGNVAVGTMVTLQFDGALTLTHSTDLVLPGAANITTTAGDVATFVEYATGDWICVAYSNVFAFSGTSANDLVRLNGSAQLPAVDGSLLTGISTEDQLAQDLAIQALMEIDALSGQLGPRSYGNAVGDAFEDESGVDTAGAVNATYDAAGDYYVNGVASTDETSAGSPTYSSGFGSAIFVDRSWAVDNNKTVSHIAFASNTAAGDYDVYILERIGAADYTPRAKIASVSHPGGSTITYFALGSPYAVPSSGTFHVGVDTKAHSAQGTTGSVARTTRATGSLTVGTNYNTGWTEDTNNTVFVGVRYASTVSAMTLPSKSGVVTAAAAPTEIRIQADIEAVDAAVLTGTPDLVLSGSRDGGSTFSTITLEDTTTIAAGQRKIIKGTVDVTGQPSGTNIIARVVTTADGIYRVHGWTIQTDQNLTAT